MLAYKKKGAELFSLSLINESSGQFEVQLANFRTLKLTTFEPCVFGSSKPSAASIGDSDAGLVASPSAPIQVSGGIDLRRLRSFKGFGFFSDKAVARSEAAAPATNLVNGVLLSCLYFLLFLVTPVVEIGTFGAPCGLISSALSVFSSKPHE